MLMDIFSLINTNMTTETYVLPNFWDTLTGPDLQLAIHVV